MGYQFIHVETYSRSGTPARGRTGARHSTGAIFGEAKRDPEYCAHVAEPKTPVRVYGQSIEQTEAELEALCATATDSRGRKLRRDAQVLLTAVASYPTPSAELRTASAAEKQQYRVWRDHTLAWLKAEYGDRLKTVVLHVDETYPHLHAYVLPEQGPGGTLSLDRLHRGRAAMAAVGESKDNLGERRKAFRDAMRGLQDSFYQAVGLPCGLTRKGPSRRRLSREAWLAEQDQARLAAKQKAELDQLQQQLAATKNELGSRISRERVQAKQKLAQLEKQIHQLERKVQDWQVRAQDAELHFEALLKGKLSPAVPTAELPGLDQLDRPKLDSPSY